MSLQVDLLRSSFNKIKPQADEFVEKFYHNLFSDYPSTKPLFEQTDMSAQKKKLLDALVLVIQNLTSTSVLATALKQLGERHKRYGILPKHYPFVGNSLIKTFAEFLGPDWTPDVQTAWLDAYGAIKDLMLQGAEAG